MKTFYFARNTRREYYELEAESEAAARAMLEEDPQDHYTGSQDAGDDYELIDWDEPTDRAA